MLLSWTYSSLNGFGNYILAIFDLDIFLDIADCSAKDLCARKPSKPSIPRLTDVLALCKTIDGIIGSIPCGCIMAILLLGM